MLKGGVVKRRGEERYSGRGFGLSEAKEETKYLP